MLIHQVLLLHAVHLHMLFLPASSGPSMNENHVYNIHWNGFHKFISSM
jgi:hypothetical protein